MIIALNDFKSQLKIADIGLVESTVELFDRLLDLSRQQFVGAGDHLVVCHHIIVQCLLDDVLRDHLADLSSLIEEWEVSFII